MVETIKILLKICETFETNLNFKSTKNLCEPFLSKYNLYETINVPDKKNIITEAILWVLCYSDGKNDLLKISELSKIDYFDILTATNLCLKNKLLINSR